jgi:hypothetical protein
LIGTGEISQAIVIKKEIHMKKANKEIVVSSNAMHGVTKHDSTSVKDELRRVSRWYTLSGPVGVIAVIVALGIAFVGFSYLSRVTGAHPLESSESSPQLGSPTFANPGEIRYRTGEKIGRLRGVMELTAGNYMIPNVGSAAGIRKTPRRLPKQRSAPGRLYALASETWLRFRS